MEIDVSELGESAKDFDIVYDPAEIEIDEDRARLHGPLELKGRAQLKGSEVRVVGALNFRAEIDCDRCIKAGELELNPLFDLVYAPESAIAVEGAHELAKNELEFSFYSGNSIDLDDLVREQVLLALPGHYLCKDDCKGLCSVCGGDKNASVSCRCQETSIDPRWDALKNLN